MSIYIITTLSKTKDYDILKSEIEKKLSDGKNYVVNFHQHDQKPDDSIVDDENNIVIESEYNPISKMLNDLIKKYPNFKFSTTDPEKIIITRWMVIVQE